MAFKTISRITSGYIPVVALFVLLLVSLYIMGDATQNSDQFSRQYTWLFILNSAGLCFLVALIAINIKKLVHQYRKRVTGSRMTLRLVLIFVALSVIPTSIVYYFSVGFLNKGIDSWFDVKVDEALKSALDLSRTSLNIYMSNLLKETEKLASELTMVTEDQAAVALDSLRNGSESTELTLMTYSGHIIATSSTAPAPTGLIPNLPDESILQQLRQQHRYVSLDPIPEAGLHIRSLAELNHPMQISDKRILQALFPISDRMGELTNNVQSAFSQYQELSYMRKPLKFSFTLTLSLVLLLSMLTAVWAAFFSARRLVAPIRVLAIGTNAVARGNYTRHLPQPSNDELGFLVQSFNEMTRQIAISRDEAEHNRKQVEENRSYLEAVLAHLSSGVITLDENGTVITANASIYKMLGVNPKTLLNNHLDQLAEQFPLLTEITTIITSHISAKNYSWEEEFDISRKNKIRTVICRGEILPKKNKDLAGYIIVFDDVTELMKAQRDAAWGDIARRLAHEIKNPLTPIQLAAERIRHKYLPSMNNKENEILDRATHTIVKQVESMKKMVNSFSDYSRTPYLHLESINLNELTNEVVDLYKNNKETTNLKLILDEDIPMIEADPERIRQLLHNLIKNSIESMTNGEKSSIIISTSCIKSSSGNNVCLCIEDTGSGFPENLNDRIFEPYVTTKPKGSGLGLAIVQKIVDEHNGAITADNLEPCGARFQILLPIHHERTIGNN